MSLAGLEVHLAAPNEVSGFSALMAAHHYLGSRGSGRLLRYVACLDGQPVTLATFGLAAWKGQIDVNTLNIDGRGGDRDGSRSLLEHLRTVTIHRRARGNATPWRGSWW